MPNRAMPLALFDPFFLGVASSLFRSTPREVSSRRFCQWRGSLRPEFHSVRFESKPESPRYARPMPKWRDHFSVLGLAALPFRYRGYKTHISSLSRLEIEMNSVAV